MSAPATLLAVAAVLGALGVSLGALGGHAMQDRLSPEQLVTWDTATRYLMWHVLAAVAIGLSARLPLVSAGWIMLLGAVLFSFSLFGWLLLHFRPLVFITPLGGLVMIAGWLWLAWKTLST
ncbi:MAG: DUF423 domain-containing protein [Natronospirillum sp.]|uniref:DUF423 domain-containing protein n=1 Tax=Natronospirillum sp. TaxID=2812955 RepID=UPI0025DD2E93|nr:DUF423 domain-containing protein [Natronospirillum sp.]MCH8551767.1 DUF423 domain-containing protein [Natronospirillum sp.]